MNAASFAEQLEEELRAHGSRERAEHDRAYLKSDLTHLGVPVPELRRVVGAVAKRHHDLPHDDVVAIARALWSEPVYDRRAAAMLWLEQFVDRLGAHDLPLLEEMIRESKTWALVDGLSEWVAGEIAAREDVGTALDRWAKDPDFWLRRAAMLTLLRELRRGKGDFDRFARYADAMLEEKEFFIRKAIGWILREVSRKDPARVHRWLLPRAARASGLTLREATKYLPAAQRTAILAAAKKDARKKGS